MSKNQIAAIYRENEQRFLSDLKEPGQLQETQVHQLRVHIKNMRVLLRLLNALTRGRYQPRRMLKMLQPVFERAGKIRTATLNIKLTQPYRSAVLLKFKQHQRMIAETHTIRLREDIEAFRTKKFSRLYKDSLEIYKDLKEGRIRKQATEYLRVLLAEVRSDIFDISDDETLHQIRHKLKEIKTIGKFLDDAGISHPFKKEMHGIAVTYDRIGLWHDSAILVEELEDYIDDLEDDRALEKTMPLLVVLKRKNLHLKKQIEKRLRVDLVM